MFARHLTAVVGCSAADWDLDGDVDLTTTNAFWRNRMVERGERRLTIASHAIPSGFLQGMMPAWCDWDRDGDLDCALTTFGFGGALFLNTTYDAGTPSLQRLALRVRPVVDSPSVARGLETAFGSSVELRVLGDEPGRVRRQFTASSHGYLQQSEYALTFGLPGGADAGAPARGAVFDLLVDFPSRSDRSILRVDRTVNPILGGLELAALVEREITVFQSGLVRIDGVDHPPTGPFAPRMGSTGRLALPGPGDPLPELASAPAPSWFVGLELDTSAAVGPVRVEELVLDGELEPAGNARCDANVWLWDVTSGTAPFPVRQEELTTSSRNARSFHALSWSLKPCRVYRVLCRVTSLRPSALESPSGTPVRNRGGITFSNTNPCDARAVVGAVPRSDQAFVELRYHATPRVSASVAK